MSCLKTLIFAAAFSAGLSLSPTALAADYAPDSLIVGWRSGYASEVKLKSGETLSEALLFWRRQKNVIYTEPNYYFKQSLFTNDYLNSNQWYLKRIKAPQAWEMIHDAPDITVAVIDTGIQTTHLDLKDNLWINAGEKRDNNSDDDNNGYIDDYFGYDFVNRTGDPSPKFKPGWTEDGITHGTVVAGVLGASGNNTIGVSGVAWRVKIMALKALDDSGQARASQVAEAIDYAVKQGAQIINLSFTGPNNSRAIAEAIARAYNSGVIVVAAGGNEISSGHGQDLGKHPLYPVCNDQGKNMVVGVAATAPLDQKASFSGYGSCIDIAAPGISIFSSTVFNPVFKLDKQYDGYWSGTSLAVPQVSAALALVEQLNPSLTPRQAVNLLLGSSDNINAVNPDFAGMLGKGRLNLETAVVAAIDKRSSQKARIVAADYDKFGYFKIVTSPTGAGQEFRPFATGTPMNLAVGDVNGDGVDEIIVAPAQGKPEVKVLNRQGKLLKSLLVYDARYQGGVSLASADLNGDGVDEIIVAPSGAIRPEVKVFELSGKKLKSFMAWPGNFYGGVSLAAGDLDGNGLAEIATVPLNRGSAQVRIWNNEYRLISQYYAFDKRLTNGWNISISSAFDARRRSGLLLVSPAKNYDPVVRLFDNRGRLVRLFTAFPLNFKGGVRTAAADLDGDGETEVVVSAGTGGSPNIAIYKINGLLIKSFFVGSADSRLGAKAVILPIQ